MVCHLAIFWINALMLLIPTLGTKFSEILSEIHTLLYTNAFENIVCELAAILSRPQCVNNEKLNNDKEIWCYV